MLEDLYRQIEGAETQMRGAEERLAGMWQARERIADLVGRGEAADGKVVVEATSRDALHTLDLNPRALRMPATDLADAIRDASRAAAADLREQTLAALRESGILAGDADGAPLGADEVRDRLRAAREAFADSARAAAQRIDQARVQRGR